MVVLGIDAASSEKAIRLAGKHDGMAAAVGLHPNEAGRFSVAETQKLRELASDTRVVAIGETGLDYHRDRSSRVEQMEAFRWHMDLAAGLSLPVIIHCRDATDDTIKVLKEYAYDGRLRGVMHCFSGNLETMKQVIEMGMFISLAGPVTYPNARSSADVAKEAPLKRLLIETDCPFLTPQPNRGKRNEPAYLVHTAERIGALRGISLSELSKITTANSAILFGLPIVSRPRQGTAAGGRGE
jgi:TatD DNase family protein